MDFFWVITTNPSADRMKLEIKANDIWLIRQWPGSALDINQCILSSALILVEGVFCEKQERGSGEETAKQGPESSCDLQVLLLFVNNN